MPKSPRKGAAFEPLTITAEHPEEYAISWDLTSDDEKAADKFLWSGDLVATSRGLYTKRKYLKGREEREARAALVRVLRNEGPLSGVILNRLAELFDDDPKFATRQLVLKSRRRNQRRNPSNSMAVMQVANYVAILEQGGYPREAAVEKAHAQFGISRKTVFKHLAAFSILREKGAFPWLSPFDASEG